MAVTEKLKDDQDNNGKTDTFELNSQITTRYQQADKPVWKCGKFETKHSRKFFAADCVIEQLSC